MFLPWWFSFISDVPMECRPGLAWFLGDKRNNLGDVGCCDESDRKLYLLTATDILDESDRKMNLWWATDILDESGRKTKLFDWFCLKVLLSLDNPVTLQDLGEVLEQLLLAASRGESDLDYYLVEWLLENLHKTCLKHLREQKVYRVLWRVVEKVRVMENKERPASWFQSCSHRIHQMHQLERKLHERRQRLHKVLRMERRERQSILHMHSLRFIIPRNAKITATASAEGDIYTKIGLHRIQYLPKYLRETGEHVGDVFMMQGSGNRGSSTNSRDNQSSDHDAVDVKSFIVDSGASVHATGDLTLFSYLDDTTTNMRLCTANGSMMEITGRATLRLLKGRQHRLVKVLFTERGERQNKEHQNHGYRLRFITPLNAKITAATASAEGGIDIMIDLHRMQYLPKCLRLCAHGDLCIKWFKAPHIIMQRLRGCAARACSPYSLNDLAGLNPWNILLNANNVSESRDSCIIWHREGIYSLGAIIISCRNIDLPPKSSGIWDLIASRLETRSRFLQQAYIDAIFLDVKFSVTTSMKGGIDIRIGSHTINALKYLSVRHPLIQMVLFADKRFEDIFSCAKSMTPRSIFNMAKRLQSFVSSNVCEADWISAKPNIESINAVTGFELNLRESFGNKPTENESQHNMCFPDPCGTKNCIKTVEAPSSTISWMVATADPPHAKGDDNHCSVYATELDDQFVHALDGVPLPVRTTCAAVKHGVVLPETSLVPVSQLSALDFRMSRLLRHSDRLSILETKEIAEHIQADQCSYNTRRCSIEQAFIPVVPIFGMGGIGKKTFSQLLPTPKHMMSVRHPLIQMVPFARKRFEDMSCSINYMGPKNMFTMARRLCSFALANVCGAEWASAKLKPESLYAGMGSESVLRENTGRSNKLTENEAQRNSAPVSCGVEHGMKAVTTKITSASWVVATAAPHHATGNRDLLQGFVTEHDDQFVHAVDGVPMPVKARGAVVTDAVVLHDVWFVPGLKSNMVSVSQLAELGYSVGFGCSECCIRSAGDGKIVGKAGLGKDGLYKLDFLKVSLPM